MMTYSKYRVLVETLVKEGKSTGDIQSEDLANYSFLNNKRMERLDKKAVVPEEYIETIQQYNRPVEWIVLTESWCGDAAQILPYINKVA
ncbi:MAG: thioredoxin family protein, partial [Flavobacteriaceae bacterium]